MTDASNPGPGNVSVVRLRCEYRHNPLGIDALNPRLSWRLEEMSRALRGVRQSAYQVLVASSEELLSADTGDLWDSGKVESDQSIQVVYAGKPLASRMVCYWTVRVWVNGDKPLMWSPVASWSMGLLAPEDWTAQWIDAGDSLTPAEGSEERPSLTVLSAIYGAEGATADVTSIVTGMVQNDGLWLNVDSVLLGGDPAIGMGKQLVVECDVGGGRVTRTVDEGTILSIPEDQPEPVRHPCYLRKTFQVEPAIRRATVYVTALGLYELRLNGDRVGDRLLTPEWTDYSKRVQYQTYDVTDLVRTGENALGVMLGKGWYAGNWQFWEAKIKPMYGVRPLLLMQLEIEGTDGSRQVVTSDGTWRSTTAGPLRFSGIYEGETVDARREMPGWDIAKFDDGAWRAAAVATPVVGRLVWQRGEPIRVTRELKPVSLAEPKPGVYVFAFDQNMVGGIQPAAPGYKSIRIEPVIEEGLTWASCSYDSIYGTIVSKWQKEGQRVTMDVTIPSNTTATVHVPTADADGVTESGKPAAECAGVTLLRVEGRAALYSVGSGTYRFETVWRKK